MSIDHGFPVDQVYHGDSRDMKEVPDDTVSLVVCSPPYNVRKPYGNHDDNMPLDEYRQLLLAVWGECKRVLRPGGRLCVNVAGVWRQPYLPLHAVIWHQLVEELNLLMRGEIIWDKGASVGVSTAWGSFASPSNPTLRDVHEQVLVAEKAAPEHIEPIQNHNIIGVYSKDDPRLTNQGDASPDIWKEDFVEWTRSVWYIATESSNRVGHPAPFPVELPWRLIQLYTYRGDIVLDPFAGSGSTCVAARLADRHYIGYDIDSEYVRIARERTAEVARQLAIPELDEPVGPKQGKSRRRKEFFRLRATTVMGPTEVRNREIRIRLDKGHVELGLKTVGSSDDPDTQKQNVKVNLSPDDARQLANKLTAAADTLQDRARTATSHAARRTPKS